MVAFAGGRAAGGLADMVGGIGNAIGSLFGGEDKGPLHIFAAISKDTSIDANRLAALGGGISDLATGLETFAKIDTAGLTNNMAQLEKMSGKGFFESIGEGVKDAGSYVAEKTGQLKEAVVSTAKVRWSQIRKKLTVLKKRKGHLKEKNLNKKRLRERRRLKKNLLIKKLCGFLEWKKVQDLML